MTLARVRVGSRSSPATALTLSVLVGLAASTIASTARATAGSPLRITTVAGEAWDALVARIQNSGRSPHAGVRIVALDSNGERVPCAEYELHADDAAQLAFTLGRCDDADRATPVTLINRDALFISAGAAPQPIAVAVTATQRARPPVDCSAEFTPTVQRPDGTTVQATSDQFDLATDEAGLGIDTRAVGWHLHRAQAPDASTSVIVRVVVRATHKVVASESVNLVCAAAPPAPPMTGSVGGGGESHTSFETLGTISIVVSFGAIIAWAIAAGVADRMHAVNNTFWAWDSGVCGVVALPGILYVFGLWLGSGSSSGRGSGRRAGVRLQGITVQPLADSTRGWSGAWTSASFSFF